MKARRTHGLRNCVQCGRIVFLARSCVCRYLLTRENYVVLPSSEVNAKCPECFQWSEAGKADTHGVVSFVCTHCGESTGGRLAGGVSETWIPSRDTYPHRRNDGWEGRS